MIESVKAVFDFIYSLLSTIIEAINGITLIFENIFTIIFNIIRVFPTSMYLIIFTFISLYLTIIIYKLFRKG